MSTTKVTDLTELTSAADSDVFLISDVDTSTSKKIQKSNITEQNFTTALKSKLDGIEASATADQTGAEIKTAYEGEADTNAFTDAEKTKLSGIETGATADQSASEIKTAYESNSDTNAFTDSEKTKLSGIETGADVTDTANVTSAGALMDSEVTNLAQVKAFDSSDYATAAQGTLADSAVQTETDPVVGAVSGIVKANGAGTISAAVAGTDYLTPTGDGSGLTGIDALPDQTGHAGQYLTTDGTTADWDTIDTDANTTTKGLYEHAHTISANYSITSGNNAMSAGPVTVDTGYSVTVPSGSVWTIV